MDRCAQNSDYRKEIPNLLITLFILTINQHMYELQLQNNMGQPDIKKKVLIY